jgi:hypothetical protein
MRVRKALVCGGIATAWPSGTAAAGAADPLVLLGEVGVPPGGQRPDLAPLLRSALEREIQALDLHPTPHGRRFVVSASLVRLAIDARGDALRASCVVSLVLRDARGGALVAILEGRARAEGDAAALATAETFAIGAAAHGAAQALPQALR